MKILTVEKDIIHMRQVEDLNRHIQFTVVDLGSDTNDRYDSDIVFPKLMYVEDHTGPALECDIGGFRVMLPLSWYIFIGEEDVSQVEVVSITSLNARDFTAIVTNPIDGFRHHFKDIKIYNVLSEYEWILPKIKNGQALAVPINDNPEKPLCIYITHAPNKIPVVLAPSDFM